MGLTSGCSLMFRAAGFPPEAMRATPPVGIEARALPVGQVLPAAKLSDDLGLPVDLTATLAKGPTVVVFYRGAWCPYCRAQLEDFQKHAGEYAKAGVWVAAVCGEPAEDGAGLRKRLSLGFPLWSDPALQWTKALGLHDPGNDVPWPALLVVDSAGKVTWRWVAETYKNRPTALEVLARATQGVSAAGLSTTGQP
jgi:peroxiredoxin